MKMNKSISKSTSDNLIDLYTRIPDYSEVKHLGQSDFINTLEKLKEEFRQCRASLYNEEFCSDSEYLAGKSSPVTNQSRFSSSKPTDNLFYYSNKFSNNNSTTAENKSSFGGGGLGLTFDDGHGKVTKINNHNLTTTTAPSTSKDNSGGANEDEGTVGHIGRGGGGEHYLSIKSCELHRTPYRATSASSLTQPGRYAGDYETRSFLLRGANGEGDTDRGGGGEKNNRNYLDDDDDDYEDDDDEEFENDNNRRVGRNGRAWSVGSSNSDLSISKWSSNPEIYRSRSLSKEYVPPSNVEQRMLQRKAQNNSAPSVAFKDQPEELPKPTFRANPVPDHVYKPLYEFIMLKNQRRSDRIREQSKRRLISQMKPFSFCKDSNSRTNSSNHGKIMNRSAIESLNNTKPLKKKRNDALGNIKTNNNRLNYTSTTLFKAKPAPPRTKALLAAIRQKEQQDYRELKKRLRSEQLLKNASLPPSMAAREKRTKITNAKIDEVLLEYQKSFGDDNRKGRRNYRETSTGTDDTGLLTDDDRMTEDEFSGLTTTTRKVTTVVKPFKFSQRSPRKFTSFGTSRHSAAATGVFESSSNDNHASRLRYQAAKIKEEDRMKREEDEMLKIMRGERRRQKLRDSHLHAWQHACSYSAEQDIAMRRQLRHAASILERETFIRDMSCMLSRVRSAPLLLEGGHRLERKKEPCKKHRDEFQKLFHSSTSGGGSGIDRPWNKLSTPRLYSSGGNKQKTGNRALSMLDRYGGGGDEKSETLALAEGTLSNSDNESSDDDEEHEQDDDDDDDNGHHNHHHHRRVRVSGIATDSGASDLEEEVEERGNGHAGIMRAGESDMTTINSKSNQSNGVGGSGNGTMVKEQDGGHSPVGTDNEIVDEAEQGENEEEKEEEENESGNNTV